MKKRKKSLRKKITNFMAGFDIDELMSINNAYRGNKLQWVKSPDRKKLGSVVTVVEVFPGKRLNTVNGPVQKYVAQLSDGTKLDTDQLNSNLMMLLEDQPPMSLAQIMSINSDPGVDVNAIKADLPPDLQPLSTMKSEPKTENIQGVNGPDDSTFGPGKNVPIQRPQVQVDTTNLFGMFSVDDTIVSLDLSIKLPDRNLLKMMYSNSKDKESFISQLAAYINNSITQDDIKQAVTIMMGQDKNKNCDAQPGQQSTPTG